MDWRKSFNPGPGGRPGQRQDSAKWGFRAGPKGVPKGAKKGAGKEQKRSPKRSPFGGPKSSKTICSPCVFAQNGPPKGAQKEPEIGPKMGDKMSRNGSNSGRKVVGNPSKSFSILWLAKGGVRKFPKIFIENSLVKISFSALKNLLKDLLALIVAK